jgi:transcriptional regulator GlxA family with amidase domain
MGHAKAGGAAIDVLFLLLPGSLVLDWAGPAEAFRIANQWLARDQAPPRFRLRFVGPRDRQPSSVGIELAGIEPLPAQVTPGAWVVLVGLPGPRVELDNPGARAAVRWLAGLRPGENGLRLVTVCAGALLAAHAGLLAGRRATTHHHHLEELRAAAGPCEVVSNRVFVIDGPVASSAGISTGIDLALHLIAGECGPALAAAVAQTMVVPLRRGPHDPELSPFLAYRNHIHPALHRVQDAVGAEPRLPWTVPRMAAAAHTSARHLNRLFLRHAGVAPLEYLRHLRLAVARAALASGSSVTRAAELAGFSSDTQLRRAWRRFGLEGSPSGVALLQNS